MSFDPYRRSDLAPLGPAPLGQFGPPMWYYHAFPYTPYPHPPLYPHFPYPPALVFHHPVTQHDYHQYPASRKEDFDATAAKYLEVALLAAKAKEHALRLEEQRCLIAKRGNS